MIKVKYDYFSGGAIAVPTDIIDKHLKLAPAASFKVLLFILRNPDGIADPDQIGIATGLNKSDVLDCLDFWEGNGIIEITEEKVSQDAIDATLGNAKVAKPVDSKNENEAEKKSVTNVKKLPFKKPTQREIALRLSESPELTIIYKEAQEILGTFGYDTQALLLMIYDFYGFPPEVIITLLQHQKNEGKLSSSSIKNRAEDWAKRGIDSLELVEDELLALEKINKTYNGVKVAAEFNGDAPTPRISKFLRTWAVEWECSEELIIYALEESKKVLTDTNKLLKKYVQSGIQSPEQIKQKKKKAIPEEIKKTYETEEIGKNSVFDWIKKYADGEENK